MELELSRVRVFDVLRNALTGELAVVMGVSGDRLDLRDKTGAIVRFKFGAHFSRVSEDDAISFRALLREVLKVQRAGAKKRTPRSTASLLKRLTKSKRR